MSWLFSRALVAEFSAGTSLDGEPLSPLSVMPTEHKFWRSDKTMEPSDLSRFGLTCAVLTDGRGAALLTSYLAAFPARTSASPGKAPASMVDAPASGEKWRELWARYDRDSSSWRTLQSSFDEDLDASSATLPTSGMTLDGVCWALPTLKPRTSATVSGLLPTPVAIDAGSGRINRSRSPNAAARPTLAMMARKNLWPTPTAVTDSGGAALCKWGGSRSRAKLRQMVTHEELNGALNPTWVEWLMGWPLGWTDLEPSATAKSHSAPQRPSENSPLNSTEEATA
jgi:hypothetical protein